MPTLIMVCGPQASGKTTYTDEFLIRRPEYKLVNSDLYWSRNEHGLRVWKDENHQERSWGHEPIDNDTLQRAYSWAFRHFCKCVESRSNIVYEATFVTKKDRKQVVRTAKHHDYKIHGVFFSPTLLTCVQRNEARVDRVPDVVLARTFAKITLPTTDEGFDRIDIR